MKLLTVYEVALYLKVANDVVDDLFKEDFIPVLGEKYGPALFCQELLDLWLLEDQPQDWRHLKKELRESLFPRPTSPFFYVPPMKEEDK